MLPDVQLSFHPSTINCLAWSDDGELAIAAGEYVHILVSGKFSNYHWIERFPDYHPGASAAWAWKESWQISIGSMDADSISYKHLHSR